MPKPRYTAGETLAFTVKRPLERRCVVSYLRARLSLSEAMVLRLVEAGAVRVNGEGVVVGQQRAFAVGDRVTVSFPPVWPPHLMPTPMDLAILYEDEHLVAVDKPAGIVVHPARGHMTGRTVQNGLLHRYRAQADDPERTVGPVHRLDRDTSGVLVFSRTRAAYKALVQQFARRRVEDGGVRKVYWAWVAGPVAWERKRVWAPCGLDRREPTRSAIRAAQRGGKWACTDLVVLARGPGGTLVAAHPRTGRNHQIRLHLAWLGHPLLGDRDYHPAGAASDLPRQALHAAELTLRHPVHGHPLTLSAPLPADLRLPLAARHAGADAPFVR